MKTAIPADETHKHFGGGQTETMVTLPKGKHTLTASARRLVARSTPAANHARGDSYKGAIGVQNCSGADRAPEFPSNSNYCPVFAGAGADGAGVKGCGDVDPEPVVLGGVAVRLVAAGEGLLLAVVPLLSQPATIRKPIRSKTATP